MSTEKNIEAIASIVSTGNALDVKDHEVDLTAIASNPISISEVGASLTSDQKYLILKRLNYNVLVSLDDLPLGATFMIEKTEKMTIPLALEILAETYTEFKDDFNYPEKDLDLVVRLLDMRPIEYDQTIKTELAKSLRSEKAGKLDSHSIPSDTESVRPSEDDNEDSHEIVDWDLQVRLEAAVLAYHSPYPEVRSVTDPFDDPSIPCETIRAYVIGIIWLGIGSFVNQFFSQRMPNISLSTSVAQLFLYPSGLLWYYIFPDFTIPIGRYKFRWNPGPWTYKEQMLATVMFSISAGAGTQYISYNIYVQRLPMFYGNTWATWGFQSLLSLSTNFMGFGFAGVLRRFACYPVKAIWPTQLPTLALNRALLQPERKENINGWTISRYYFFFFSFAASFIYFWIPNYLFAAISTFNWMTWIKPDNFNLAMITGSTSGLGLNPVPTFDWNVLSFNSPLTVPFYNQANTFAGLVIAFPIICAIYWTNSKWTGYLPINSNHIFNNQGEPYDVRVVLNKKGLLDKEKYDQYGPPFYSAANLVVYGAFYAIYPFSFFYEIIIRWKSLKDSLTTALVSLRNFRKPLLESYKDPHSKMMSHYKEVPDWHYVVILVISIVLAIVCVEIYPTDTPVWAIFFALAINFVFMIPFTALYSATGFSLGLNVLVELIIGYALPGNSQASMIIKAFGYNIDGQAESFVGDQKMGHYAKIPPRALFRAQLLAMLISGFVGLAVMNWQIDSMKDICTTHNKQKFTCPDANSYFSASVMLGTIGPRKVFGGLYPVLQYCFLIGFVMVFPALAFKWYAPKKWTKHFQPSIFIGGMMNYAPYNLTYFTGGIYLSWVFMSYLKRRYLAWWEKYNFLLGAGLNAGVAFSAIIIFFSVQYHPKNLSWWGNNVPFAGIDGNGASRLSAADAPDGYFGPRIGHFP